MKERCRETLERVYLFLDGEVLSETERYEIKVHLEECPPCYEQYGVEREIQQKIISRLRGTTPCPDHLKSRIANLLEEF
jgi:mycothiol system anti-sigma-R factor